jgi:hypothetical protein
MAGDDASVAQDHADAAPVASRYGGPARASPMTRQPITAYPRMPCDAVRNVIEYRSALVGAMLCCQRQRMSSRST